MDAAAVKVFFRAVIVIVALLQLTDQNEAALDQMCTSGFSDPLAKDSAIASQLIPLLGRYDEDYGNEQIIFPRLKFTCPGTLAQWIFRGRGNRDSSCKVQLATWRLGIDTRGIIPTQVYQRVSTTSGNTARTVVDGSTFIYELQTPVQVQRGDIVGVEIASRCTIFDVQNNILGLNVSGNGSTSTFSYRRSGSGQEFFLQSTNTNHEEGYQPLIQVVMGLPNEPTTEVLESTFPPAVETTTVTALKTTTDPGEEGIYNTTRPTDADEEGNAALSTNEEAITDENRVNETVRDNRFERELLIGKLKVIIPAACGSAIVALVVVVGACVSVMCAKLQARVRVCSHCTNKMTGQDGGEMEHHTNSQGTLLQQNAAYDQCQLHTQSDNELVEQHRQTNEVYGTQFEVSYEDINYGSEAYESLSEYGQQDNFRPNYTGTIDKKADKEAANRPANGCIQVAALKQSTCEKDKENADYRESGAYDKLERMSEAYDTIDYRQCTLMQMSKNIAYAGHDIDDRTTDAVAQAAAVCALKSQAVKKQVRESYGDESYYEHVL